MKAIVTAILFASGVSYVMAQEGPRIYTGLSAGTHLSWLTNKHYSNVAQEQLPGLGWALGMTSEVDLNSKLAVVSGLGVAVDESRSEFEILDVNDRNKLRYAWLEANSTLFYKPLRRSTYALVTGAGFSARRIIRSTYYSEIKQANGADSWLQVTQTEMLFSWNYFVTPQGGIEFILPHAGGRLMCLIQYHQGLRELYQPYEPEPTVLFDYALVQPRYKLLSAGVGFSWMWGIKKRSDFRNPN